MNKLQLSTRQTSESTAKHTFATVRRIDEKMRVNALHTMSFAMAEAKKRSGLSQSAIARRLGMPQPNVSRIEHSEVVTFNTFAEYLAACGFYFTINLQPVEDNLSLGTL